VRGCMKFFLNIYSQRPLRASLKKAPQHFIFYFLLFIIASCRSPSHRAARQVMLVNIVRSTNQRKNISIHVSCFYYEQMKSTSSRMCSFLNAGLILSVYTDFSASYFVHLVIAQDSSQFLFFSTFFVVETVLK